MSRILLPNPHTSGVYVCGIFVYTVPDNLEMGSNFKRKFYLFYVHYIYNYLKKILCNIFILVHLHTDCDLPLETRYGIFHVCCVSTEKSLCSWTILDVGFMFSLCLGTNPCHVSTRLKCVESYTPTPPNNYEFIHSFNFDNYYGGLNDNAPPKGSYI